MANDFDIAARNYDQAFTNSKIGTLQRKQVYKYLNKHLLVKKQLNILEINCGTGEDAIWLTQNGHQVLATDASQEMISIAKNKNNSHNAVFQQIPIQELNQLENENSFDLIFSNFGGLNCLNKDEFNEFLKQSKRLIKPNGNLVLVIMPKNCIWDNFYLFLKGKWKHVGRRNSLDSVLVNVNGQLVNTWYYNPKDILILGKELLLTISHKPIGFFVPPSYLESFFKKKKLLLSCLEWLDRFASRLSFLSRFSDHYIIHFKA